MRHVRPLGRRDQSWQTFIRNHIGEVWASEFLQHYDVLIRPIFAFFVVVHGTRAVVHFNVTRNPTDAWTAQQLREATPYGEAPRYLVRDNDDQGSGHNNLANSGVEARAWQGARRANSHCIEPTSNAVRRDGSALEMVK
jgi:hypothetical protein